MSYVPVPVGLSADKLRKLAHGHGVRVSAANVGSGVTIHMTRRQAEKTHRHIKVGKGLILRLSPAQVKHHMRGEGWMADALAGQYRKDGGPILGTHVSSCFPRARVAAHVTPVTATTTGDGIAASKRPAKRARTTGQQSRSADHPMVTSFERDPLPGEHFAIPQ
jgi:hypothetical protein